MNITPEILKVVAEGMGYKVVHSECGEPCMLGDALAIRINSKMHKYTPHLTNAEQCMEIMEKLKIRVTYRRQSESWEAYIDRTSTYKFTKTINEAVVLAAYEYFKGC